MNHEDEVLDVAFVPKSPWIVTTGYERTLRLWERNTGRLLPPPQPLGIMA
jgi:WD40 repeat protein